MKIIGITGGVGAGKSAILSYLKENHSAVIMEADKVGHLVMEPGESCYAKILQVFGKEILREDETIDRGKLGAIVFQDTELLQRLNEIVHPAVKQKILSELTKEQEKKEKKLFIIEAALLLEDHYDEICDEIWYIHTDAAIRAERLRASRGYDEEKIAGIMANQKTPEEFRSGCQIMIDNSGEFADTCRQIDKQLGR